MKSIVLKISLAVLFAWMLSTASFSQGRHFRMIDSIPGITKEQKVKIASLREANRIDMNELQSKKAAATTWEEKDKIDHQLIDLRAKHRNEVRAVLTQDQQKYFDEQMKKGFEGKGMRHERAKGPRGSKHKEGCPMHKEACPMHGEGEPGHEKGEL